MSWLSAVVLVTAIITRSLAGPTIPRPTAVPRDLNVVLGKKDLPAPAPTPGPRLLKREDPELRCNQAVVPSSCPATYCICTSTLPQPWKVTTQPPVGTWAGWVATVSDTVSTFGIVTTGDNACPYTKKEDAGPSILLAPKVSDTCGPTSTWTPEGAAFAALPPDIDPSAPVLSNLPKLEEQKCSLGDRGACMCPTDRLPNTITPGGTCGSTLTAGYNCVTSTVNAFSDGAPQVTGVACLDPSEGWKEIHTTRFHILQPDDDTKEGKKIYKGEDTPFVRRVDGEMEDVPALGPDCSWWYGDNGKVDGLGKYKANPCKGWSVGPTLSASVTCSNVGKPKTCVCDADPSLKPPLPAKTMTTACQKEDGKDGFWGTRVWTLSVY